jgi:hypothetical protein
VNTEKTSRIIGYQHRTKKTKDGEARPTIFAITNNPGESVTEELELPDDLAELDWIYAKLPTAWRKVEVGEDLSGIERHHIKWREPGKDETLEAALTAWPLASLDVEVKNRGKKNERKTLLGIPVETASAFTGMQKGDTLVGQFGGSGSSLNIALINRASEIGARLFLTASLNVKKAREAEQRGKEADALTVVELYRARPALFHEMFPIDAETWETMHRWDLTEAAMDQRKRLIQRAEAAARHTVYASRQYVGSALAQKVLEAKMGDATVSEVIAAEDAMQKELEASVEAHPLYQRLFADMKGVGPRFFGKLLSAICDIRRFPREGVGAFLTFSGQAVQVVDGKHSIQRNRRGGGNNPGNPEIRQAVWLLVEMQFSRQGEDTEWGKRFLEVKKGLAERNPTQLVCDTEIPLTEGKYEVGDGGVTVIFGRNKRQFFKDGCYVIQTNGDKKTLVLPPEVIPLAEGKWKTANSLCEIEMPGGTIQYRPGKTRNTKIHIHKKAKWRLGTLFMVWVFKEWWNYIDEQEALRKNAQASGI